MKEINVEEMMDNSRKLYVTLEQPDGASETYLYYVDTPAFCIKINGAKEEIVDFDFIPDFVVGAVQGVIGNLYK